MYVIVNFFCIFWIKTFSLCFQKMAAQPQNLFLLTFRQIWNRYVQSVSHPSTDTKRLTTLKNAKRRRLKTTVTNHDSSWTLMTTVNRHRDESLLSEKRRYSNRRNSAATKQNGKWQIRAKTGPRTPPSRPSSRVFSATKSSLKITN